MAFYSIDTVAAIKQLQDAQCDYSLAEAIVSLIQQGQQPLASKSDLNVLEGRLTGQMDSLESKLSGRMDSIVVKLDALDSKLTGRMDSLETKLSVRMDSLETKLSRRMDSLDTKLSGQMANIEVNMKGLENRMKIWIVVAFVLASGLSNAFQYFLLNGS